MADSLSKEKNVKKKMSKKRQNFLANPIEMSKGNNVEREKCRKQEYEVRMKM